MYCQEVFSWAEDQNGRMVYVDDVPNGLSCNCICPSCHEKLKARHGNERAHGFAHASKERGANLEICLKVIMFKLAEQIIKTEKRICAPSYYGIFKSKIIEFETVEINGCFEREDRQPDVIATTKDNQKYLIDFCFSDYTRHKQEIDYQNLNCLEIDLAGQRINDRDSLKNFLLNSDENRRWLNNDSYFNSIEELYLSRGKNVLLKASEECQQCPIKHSCCAVRDKNRHSVFLSIIQNEKQYRLCKTKEYTKAMDDYNKQQEEYRKYREENQRRYRDKLSQRNSMNVDTAKKSCFDCQNNLQWANKNGMANCGCRGRLGLPLNINPEQAESCLSFIRKI